MPRKKAAGTAATKWQAKLSRLPGAVRGPIPDTIIPQLAQLVAKPPDGPDWIHEIKFDAYRTISRIENRRVQLLSRNKLDWTHRFRAIAAEAIKLLVHSAVLDGEVVAMLPSGVSSFQALQNALNGSKSGSKICYYVFDL